MKTCPVTGMQCGLFECSALTAGCGKMFGNKPPGTFKPTLGEYQLCPKCNGQGIVSKPPYIAGDIREWTSNETSFKCDVCNGEKIIQRPVIKN